MVKTVLFPERTSAWPTGQMSVSLIRPFLKDGLARQDTFLDLGADMTRPSRTGGKTSEAKARAKSLSWISLARPSPDGIQQADHHGRSENDRGNASVLICLGSNFMPVPWRPSSDG